MINRIGYIEPSAEPVSLDEAKLSARVDNDLVGGSASSLDDDVASAIKTAREQAEHITGRCYRAQLLRAELPDWPSTTDALPVFQATACVVKYWNGADWTLLDPSTYDFAAGGIGNTGTVLAPRASWPALAAREVGPRVRIDLTAGPADGSAVPECVKRYIKASVATWVNNPSALKDVRLDANPLFERLLDGERLWA